MYGVSRRTASLTRGSSYGKALVVLEAGGRLLESTSSSCTVSVCAHGCEDCVCCRMPSQCLGSNA